MIFCEEGGGGGGGSCLIFLFVCFLHLFVNHLIKVFPQRIMCLWKKHKTAACVDSAGM